MPVFAVRDSPGMRTEDRRSGAQDALARGERSTPDEVSATNLHSIGRYCSSRSADQLHEALGAAGIQRPIVAGHSLGGALAQVYAAKYDVAGLVLMDGLTSGVAGSVLARLGTYQSLAAAGRVGLLRPIAGMMVDPAYPSALREQMRALRARSSALGAVVQEGAVAARTALPEMREVELVLRSGRVPVLVIGAGATDVPQLPQGAFVDSQRTFAAGIPGAQFAIVHHARHYVMAARPAEVAGLLEAWATRAAGVGTACAATSCPRSRTTSS
jgi:pimeloyl-ACP methyl ester carboxylesterase